MDARSGNPTVLVGASGCGKTSLLKQIAGWIGDDVFFSDAGAMSPAQRRAMTTLCLHDAAVLDDTVRANLFAGSQSDETLWGALVAVELEARTSGAPEASTVGFSRTNCHLARRNGSTSPERGFLSARSYCWTSRRNISTRIRGVAFLGGCSTTLQTRVVVIASHHSASLPLANVIRLDRAGGHD